MAGAGVLHSEQGHDVARLREFELLARVRVHLDDAADALGLAREGQGAIAVVHDFEGKGAQRLVRIDFCKPAGLMTFEIHLWLRLHFRGVRQIVNNCIKNVLYTLVFKCRSTVSREEVQVDGALANAALERVDVGLVAFQIGLEQVVVLLDRGFDQLLTPFLDLVGHIGGDVGNLVRRRIVGIRPDPRLARQKVDNALELVFDTDWQHHDEWVRAQDVLDLLDDAVEVGADTVELVDEDNARNLGFVGVAPVGLRLGLDAAGSAKYPDAAVEYLQRAIDLDREIHVSRGVEQVDLVLVPLQRRRRRGDRDAALFLLRHPVHLRLAVMHLTNAVDLPGMVQEALRHRRLPGIDVGNDADVSQLFDLGHGSFLRNGQAAYQAGMPANQGRGEARSTPSDERPATRGRACDGPVPAR